MGDKWHLDEVFLQIKGKTSYVWRAVDQDGNVLDMLVQRRRNKAAAKKFFTRTRVPELLKGCTSVPRVLITDKLASYAAAHQDVMPRVEHRKHKRLNNRAGCPLGQRASTDPPTRTDDARLQSPGHAQRFLAACGPIREHFCPCRHRLRAEEYRRERARRCQVWHEVSSLQQAT